MVKATGRPEHVVKKIVSEDRFRFNTSRVYDVDSTFGSGKPLFPSYGRVESEDKINQDISTHVDLDDIGADVHRLSRSAKEALRKMSQAGQRLHREMKKKEGSIRAIVLVAQKNSELLSHLLFLKECTWFSWL